MVSANDVSTSLKKTGLWLRLFVGTEKFFDCPKMIVFLWPHFTKHFFGVSFDPIQKVVFPKTNRSVLCFLQTSHFSLLSTRGGCVHPICPFSSQQNYGDVFSLVDCVT